MYKSRKKSDVLFAGIFVILAMWMILSVHCRAAEKNNDEKQSQIVRIGSFEDTFDYIDKNGVRRGYGYELMQALAGYTGWKFEYVKCDWSNCFSSLFVSAAWQCTDNIIHIPRTTNIHANSTADFFLLLSIFFISFIRLCFMMFQTPGQKQQVLFLYQSVLQYVHSSLLLCTAAV